MSRDELNELIELISQFDNATKMVIQRIKNLKNYESSGSVKRDELVKALSTSTAIETRFYKPNNRISHLMQYLNEREIMDFKLKDFEVESIKSRILEILSELANINASLNDIEEKFQKYNLPKRDCDYQSNERYLKRMREFMEEIWREAAEKSRKSGNNCLMEWMVKLSDSPQADRKEALMITKTLMIELGVEISMLLVDYLWTISLFQEWSETSKRLLEIDNLIRCLSIEEGSVVIERFVEVVELFHQMMRSAKRAKMADRAEKGKSVFEEEEMSVDDESLWMEKEEELFHQIMMEILRFEASFRSPDLPMILMSEIYSFVADTLREFVLKKKLRLIKMKIDDLKKELRVGSNTASLEENLKPKVERIWNSLAFDCTNKCN